MNSDIGGAAAPLDVSAPPTVDTAPRKKPFQFDQRWMAPIFITLLLLGAHYSFHILEHYEKTLLAIGTCVLLEAILGRIFYGKVPHLASSYISGISVGILLRSPEFWPYAMCAAITISSKYVIRWKNRHIWNPSNFGISAMLILAHESVATLSIQFDNKLWAMIVIWCVGCYIISRLKRFHITFTFVATFIVLAGVRSLITGDSFWAEVGPLTGPMYQLYIFFMITDPKTTVSSVKGQMLVAFLVAVAETILRLFQVIHAPYYALFIVGPIFYVMDIYKQDQKNRLAATATA